MNRFRFPRAGTPNAKSELKMATFQLNDKGQIVAVELLELTQSLSVLFPVAEYLVRAGWTPSGDQYVLKLDLISNMLFCSTRHNLIICYFYYYCVLLYKINLLQTTIIIDIYYQNCVNRVTLC